MHEVIGWGCVSASGILFLAALIELVISWRANSRVRDATDQAAAMSEKASESKQTLEEHAGIDFKGQWEALAALASALKDLDRTTRLLLLSLAFMAIGAASLGLTDLAAAVSEVKPSH